MKPATKSTSNESRKIRRFAFDDAMRLIDGLMVNYDIMKRASQLHPVHAWAYLLNVVSFLPDSLELSLRQDIATTIDDINGVSTLLQP